MKLGYDRGGTPGNEENGGNKCVAFLVLGKNGPFEFGGLFFDLILTKTPFFALYVPSVTVTYSKKSSPPRPSKLLLRYTTPVSRFIRNVSSSAPLADSSPNVSTSFWSLSLAWTRAITVSTFSSSGIFQWLSTSTTGGVLGIWSDRNPFTAPVEETKKSVFYNLKCKHAKNGIKLVGLSNVNSWSAYCLEQSVGNFIIAPLLSHLQQSVSSRTCVIWRQAKTTFSP